MHICKCNYCCERKIRYDLGNSIMSVSTLFSKLTGICRVPMNTAQSMPFSEVPSLLSKLDLFNGGVQPKNSSPFC